MQSVLLWTAAAAALALVAGCQTPGEPSTLPAAQAFDADAAARSQAPGVVGAIFRDGVVTDVFAWGGADCAGQGAADVAAAYEIGSISKQVTSVALLRLWEQGRVDVDAALGTYLVDIPAAWRPVTLRQLLTHTSGVPDYEEAGGYGVYETEPTAAQVYAIVGERPLDFAPGTRWSYSNTGYFLLSQVVQRVSGRRFGDYLRGELFEPLGMTQTFMGGYAPPSVHLAQGCRPGEGEVAAHIPVRPITEASTFGAGGVSSTLRDWALWDDALRDGRLLSPAGMELLMTTQHLVSGEDTGYAMGLFVGGWRDQARLAHSGQTQGFSADYWSFPERDIGVIVFANTYGARPGALMQAMVLKAMPELSFDRLVAPTDPDPALTATVRRALHQSVASEGPRDLLAQNMQALATQAEYAPLRDELRAILTGAEGFHYLRSETPEGADYVRHVYRVTNAGETTYITAGWRQGQLYRLRWEDE